MTDDELLAKVKIGLNEDDSTENDGPLRIATIGAKQYMLSAGVSQINIETELGIAALTIGVNDIWGSTNSVLDFSPLFKNFITQLAIKSI